MPGLLPAGATEAGTTRTRFAAGSPHAAHCGRRVTGWQDSARFTVSSVHTCSRSPLAAPASHFVSSSTARCRPAARVGASDASGGSGVPDRRRRSRAARHSQHGPVPGSKAGPTHTSGPQTLASSQGVPSDSRRALISARRGSR
ncbi:hypothetical protein GCM10020001_043710 [Nonomuraea salmonea]